MSQESGQCGPAAGRRRDDRELYSGAACVEDRSATGSAPQIGGEMIGYLRALAAPKISSRD
jgi:hypothetical protein